MRPAARVVKNPRLEAVRLGLGLLVGRGGWVGAEKVGDAAEKVLVEPPDPSPGGIVAVRIVGVAAAYRARGGRTPASDSPYSCVDSRPNVFDMPARTIRSPSYEQSMKTAEATVAASRAVARSAGHPNRSGPPFVTPPEAAAIATVPAWHHSRRVKCMDKKNLSDSGEGVRYAREPGRLKETRGRRWLQP